MHKYFLLLLIFGFLPFSSSLTAQENKNSIFYFKNGTIYIGEVLNDDRDSVEVRLIDGNDVRIFAPSVKRYLAAKDIMVFPDGRYNPVHGFFFNTGIGFNAEALVGNDDRVSTHTPYMFGWHLNSRWSVAVGFGFEFNEAEVAGFSLDTGLTSFFVYGRYNLTEEKRRPFVYTRIGGASPQNGEVNEIESGGGGANIQIGGGFQFASRTSSRYILSLGYHLQNASGRQAFFDVLGGEVIVDYDVWIRRFIFTVAVEFNRRPRGYRRK